MIDHKMLAVLLTLLSDKKLSLYELTIKTKFSIKEIKAVIIRINEFLLLKGMSPLIYKNGYYTFSEQDNSTDFLIDKLLKNEQLLFPQRERLLLIYLFTFIKQEYLSNIHYQEVLNVSKNTVLTDIKLLREELAQHDVALNYSRSTGYQLEGNVQMLHCLTVEKISELLKNPIGTWILTYIFEKAKYPQLYEQINNQVLNYAQMQNLVPIEHRLTEIIYSIIFIVCSYNNGNLRMTIDENLAVTSFTQLVDNVLTFLNEKLTLTISFSEIDKKYFSLLFAGCFEGKAEQQSAFFESLIHLIIKKMEAISLLDFSENEDFILNLKRHLIPAYYRLCSGILDYNDYTQQIKLNYPELFSLVKQSLEPLQLAIAKPVPDDEIAYFVLHFGGYLQNSYKIKNRKYRAAIVCPNGVSSSLIIRDYLKELFTQIEFKGVSTIEKLLQAPKGIYDLVFSTTDLKLDVPTYLVSTLMSDEQLMELDYLVTQDFPNMEHSKTDADELIQIIEQYASINQPKELKFALKKFLKEQNIRKDERPLLKELLTEATYQYTTEQLNWEDAIRLAAKPLLDSDKITATYPEAMINKVKEFGPFINLGKEIAIPHARPEDGVNEVGMSILVLENPIYLLDDPKQKISILICIAAIDSKTHLKALSQLTMLLRDDESVNQLKASKKYSDIEAIIE